VGHNKEISGGLRIKVRTKF